MVILDIQEYREMLAPLNAYFDVGETGEHYRLGRSGLHVGNFYDLSRAFQSRNFTEYLARLLARGICNSGILQLFRGSLPTFDSEGPLFLLAPAFGGIPLQYALAFILPVNDIRVLTLKKNTDDLLSPLEIPSWFEYKPGMVGIFVDDLFATGGTLKAVMKAFQGLVIAAAVGIDRSQEELVAIPKVAIARDPGQVYEPGNLCLWCREGIPVVNRPKSKLVPAPIE